MLKSLKMSSVASFDSEGINIQNLNKVNFIYGTNGTGKSTISHFFNDTENIKYSNCVKTWVNNVELDSLVYNKKFREENFGNGKIKGIFTLGKATKEEKELIDTKLAEAKEAKEEYHSKKEAYDRKVDEREGMIDSFKDHVAWNKIYKKYETNFKEAFKGCMQKKSFRDRLLVEYNYNNADAKPFDILKENAETVFGKRPETILPIQEIEFSRNNLIETDVIWQTKIIGKADVDIAKLIQRLNINDWVSEGKNYIQEGDAICPFCQQKTITEGFKKQLDRYFDKTFLESTQKAKQLKDEYVRLSDNTVNILDAIERAEKINENSKLDIDKFSANFKTLVSQLSSNKELLNSKEREPSRSVALVSTKEQMEIISKLIRDANKKIKTHNYIVDNYNNKRRELIKCIWKYIIEEHKSDISLYKKQLNGVQKGIDNLQVLYERKEEEFQRLEVEAKELGKNLTSIEPTINEINNILKFYGFLNFEIVPSQERNFYQIKREDGSLAESTLSEGEITFITFLYYLQLAKGALDRNKISEERILIIDDPISSLDSNVLFIISTLIKNIIKDIRNDIGTVKQLLLLTHNVYFHKEVSFIDGRSKECKNTCYWILKKHVKFSHIQFFDKKNPIKTSYCLLWEELKERRKSSLLTIQNIMRRIIENYFKILGKYSDDNIVQVFKTKEEQEICRSLIAWINDGSHSLNDDLYIEHQDVTIEKYMNVFHAIFVATKHEEHYNMMMGIEDVEDHD